jgi:N-acetylglucosamine kinase
LLYGFDIGGTKIAFSVFDQQLVCVFSEQQPTPHEYTDFMVLINDWVKQADLRFSCRGTVGIGFPGAVNPCDRRLHCANVPAIEGRHLADDLTITLGRDVSLENDANCFLLSEYHGGSGDGFATVLGITLGTGVGAAIFVNGAIHRGYNAFAGEIGHCPIPATMLLKYPKLPQFSCGCGRKMCLETYISGTGLANLYKHYAGMPLKSPDILDKYRAGDKTAINVVDIYLDLFAAGLGCVILVLDPDVIILGGGLSNFEALVPALTARLPEHLLKGMRMPTLGSATFGAAGGVRGAALLNYP